VRGTLLALALAGCRGAPEAEAATYFRGRARECVFRVERGEGWTIESVTGPLAVWSRYGADDALLEAEAVRAGKGVRVSTAEGEARIRRDGAPEQRFPAPRGVIVTSAPDWTDTWRICRLYDRKAGGRQSFPGLWIHPDQPAQALTFTAEAAGTDTALRDGRPHELLRLSIRLRGNSPYLAWVDGSGRMIKLVSLPFTEKSAVLVLEGFEDVAAMLKP
jgi:hypothetical protein